MPTIKVVRTHPDYGLTATDESGTSITMDTSTESGGSDYGIRPMQGLLMSLGGCSAIDVLNIMSKQRQRVDDLSITISGEREENRIPSLWKKIDMHFEISGDIDIAKANHAVSISIEKYCSVAETLRRAGCTISWTVTALHS